MRRKFIVLLFLVALVAGGLWFAATRMSLSALNESGPTEIYAATQAKRWFIRRAARGLVVPPRTEQSVNIGGIQFRGSCASCHGMNGRTPTDIGRAMYPRAPDLGASRVQQWSDAELFWIVKNGVRLTGMPGFGKMLSDEQVWPLVHYLRSLDARKNQAR